MYKDGTACIEWETTSLAGEGVSGPSTLTPGSASHTRSFGFQNGKMRLVRGATALQLADILTTRKGLHYPQWKACVEGILLSLAGRSLLLLKGPPSSSLKEGWIAKALKSSHVGPYEGCVDMTREAKARARHDLNPSRPLGRPGRRRASWLTAPGRCGNAVEA